MIVSMVPPKIMKVIYLLPSVISNLLITHTSASLIDCPKFFHYTVNISNVRSLSRTGKRYIMVLTLEILWPVKNHSSTRIICHYFITFVSSVPSVRGYLTIAQPV